MGQITFYPNFKPVWQWFGGVARAILGTGTGKFRSENYYSNPINQKLFLIDTSPGQLMAVAKSAPHLNTVISMGAELFSLMRLRHVDKNGEDIINSKILKFLLKPNPLQTYDQYSYEFYVQNAVYNKTFQYKIQKNSFEKDLAALWLLPSGWMKINTTGKIYRQTNINDIIVSYEMVDDKALFETDRIIYMAEGVGDTLLNPVSRIEAMQIPLSNIMAALKSYNKIVAEKGMIGYFAPDTPSKDSDGALPFSKDEAERFRTEYQNQYHLDSTTGHVSMTTQSTKWVPMSFPVRDLMLLEGVEDAFSAVIAAYRHDRDIYPSVKGATFENKAAGMRATIQNGMQPLADKLMEQLTHHLIEESTGEKLVACYDHLPAMREDELKKAQTRKEYISGLSQLFKDTMITPEQYATFAEIEFEGITNNPQNASQANLRGLVGSTMTLLQINQFVAQGFLDQEAATNIIMQQFGYEKATAASMITKLKVDMSIAAPSTSLPKE